MFDLFSWQHILILLVVALVVVGPNDLPHFMHTLGKWVAKARSFANEFRRSFDEMARQTELDELRKKIEDLKNSNLVTEAGNSAADAGTGIPVLTNGDGQPPPELVSTVLCNNKPSTGECAVTYSTTAELAGESSAS